MKIIGEANAPQAPPVLWGLQALHYYSNSLLNAVWKLTLFDARLTSQARFIRNKHS